MIEAFINAMNESITITAGVVTNRNDNRYQLAQQFAVFRQPKTLDKLVTHKHLNQRGNAR